LIRITAGSAKKNMEIIIPMIGEAVNNLNPTPSIAWWENIA